MTKCESLSANPLTILNQTHQTGVVQFINEYKLLHNDSFSCTSPSGRDLFWTAGYNWIDMDAFFWYDSYEVISKNLHPLAALNESCLAFSEGFLIDHNCNNLFCVICQLDDYDFISSWTIIFAKLRYINFRFLVIFVIIVSIFVIIVEWYSSSILEDSFFLQSLRNLNWCCCRQVFSILNTIISLVSEKNDHFGNGFI